MTTHTDLIARLREHTLHYSEQESAADALESLEQQVAALTETNKMRTTQLSQVTLELRQMQAGTLVEDLKDQVAALMSAVKDVEVVCDSYAAGNQRLSDEKDALTKDVAYWRFQADEAGFMRVRYGQELAATQAREAKLREALVDYDNQASEYDGRTSKELGDRIKSLLAPPPTDDSALMERLKAEYERGYADASEILTGVDRSMT